MIRIGQGFDVHEFADNRPLIIGGIDDSLRKRANWSLRCRCITTYNY